ncbi:hypothetical protein BFJ70_g16421 [Fusarium oxysporum]|nr:hypothetical protein NW769_015244 [Fusarium oxysporum]KAJ4212679.1 hypothetical protein NW760_015294 [Fusarium oxysporum]RKL11212.1 hypothetical protein BFJ70_g16421 [Fusarium oxysporum]
MSKYAAAHAKPQGPGDARPTALQIVKDEGLLGKLSGKVVLITGGNQGIGLETARAIHATGATVYVTARTSAKLEQAISDITSWPEAKSDAPVYGIELRLDSLASVRAAAKSFLEKSDKLNILINNAGVMATPEGKTEDGFEIQFGTNHLGHFLLFQLLRPALLAATTPLFQSRVISVASLGHRVGPVRFDDFNFEKEAYDRWAAYGQSKTANIYLAAEIDRRFGDRGLHALAVHPGVINTNLGQYVDLDAMPKDEAAALDMKSPAQGAATTVYAALSKEWEGRGGKYLLNCVEDQPKKPDLDLMSLEPGYAPWIYNKEAERRLWEESNKLVGFEE